MRKYGQGGIQKNRSVRSGTKKIARVIHTASQCMNWHFGGIAVTAVVAVAVVVVVFFVVVDVCCCCCALLLQYHCQCSLKLRNLAGADWARGKYLSLSMYALSVGCELYSSKMPYTWKSGL